MLHCRGKGSYAGSAVAGSASEVGILRLAGGGTRELEFAACMPCVIVTDGRAGAGVLGVWWACGLACTFEKVERQRSGGVELGYSILAFHSPGTVSPACPHSYAARAENCTLAIPSSRCSPSTTPKYRSPPKTRHSAMLVALTDNAPIASWPPHPVAHDAIPIPSATSTAPIGMMPGKTSVQTHRKPQEENALTISLQPPLHRLLQPAIPPHSHLLPLLFLLQ